MEESFHTTCFNEVAQFNQNPEIKLNINTHQIQLLTLILGNTGLQLREVLTLKKNNFDEENREITYFDKKFKLTHSKFNEVMRILQRLSSSDNLFSLSISYPSRFFLSCIK